MHTTEKRNRFTKLNVAAVLGLLVLSTVTVQVRAQEQPKPGLEQKKMEVRVGDWTYEGVADPSPFGPAGGFKGKSTARMVLSGFFLEGREEDTNDTGYLYQGINLLGYDPVTKAYYSHGFENDGTHNSSSATLTGNTWTSTGTRADSKGKVYKTRSVETFSSDGRTSTFATEYSADDGKTWLPLWKGSMKKVAK